MEHLRISTMTAVAKLCSEINIEKMYDSINIGEIVKFIEYKEKHKGYSKKLDKKPRKQKKRVTFYNQSTILVHKIFGDLSAHSAGVKLVYMYR